MGTTIDAHIGGGDRGGRERGRLRGREKEREGERDGANSKEREIDLRFRHINLGHVGQQRGKTYHIKCFIMK
jgi:hypothetical protein